MASPVLRGGPGAVIASRILYHGGRIATYALIGLFVGMTGETLRIAGLHSQVSVVTGILVLGYLALRLLGLRYADQKVYTVFLRLKKPFQHLIRQRTPASLFLLGILNGLLPCAMVYLAAGTALALGKTWTSLGFMVVFGLGTTPLLWLASEGFRNLIGRLKINADYVYSALSLLTGLLLILRGLHLGVPWLSPDLMPWAGHAETCR
jgi:sulfite exporter TauE/SafE